MKVKEILEKYEALQELSEKELPFQTALCIADNVNAIKTAVEVAEKKLNEIAEKNADRDENGEKIFTDPSHFKLKEGNTYLKEREEVLESEVDVTLKKFSKTDFSDCSVKPRVMLALLDVIE